MRGRRGQRGARGRGRVRGQAFPPRKISDQEIDNEDSRPPTPQPQDGEPLELENREDLAAPAPAPRTLARLPSMPLQVSLRARKGLQNGSADSEITKDNLNNVDAPNTPLTMETSGRDGSSPEEEEDRPTKRRRILENGIATNAIPVADATTNPSTRGRGRGRGRARGSRARGTDAARGRGRGRGRGKGSRGGPGSRGGRGAYRTRGSRARGGRGGIAKIPAGPADNPVEKVQEDKAERITTTTNGWYSGVTGSSYRHPTYTTISLLQEKKIKLIAESATLEDLKKRHSGLKDRFKNVAKLMMARDYSRASKTLKELKNGRDLINQAPWAKEIYQELDEKLSAHLNHLDDELHFKQTNTVQVYDASLKVVQRSTEVLTTLFHQQISMGEMMDRCIVAFIREKRDISQLWKVRDPYLNNWVLDKCGANRIDQITMTDLIENFMPRAREGRDCSSYDRPQVVSRTNLGFHDRSVMGTLTARARKIFGDVVSSEKDSLMTPPQSPKLEQNHTGVEIDEQELEEILAHQSILDLIQRNDKPEVARAKLVWDCKYDPKNPGHFLPPRGITTREFTAIDTLKHLREDIEFSDSDYSEYSEEDDYEIDDEDVSADEHLPNQRMFDCSISGSDYRNRDMADDEEKWLQVVAQVRKERGGLTSKRQRSPSDDGDDESEKEEDTLPSCMENSLHEQPRSRSPSSGPLTSKHFDFVLTSEASSQSLAPIESARAMKENQRQLPMFGARVDYPESLILFGKTNGYLQDKSISRPILVPGNGPPSKPTNTSISLKRTRDGSGKGTQELSNISSYKFSHSNLSENGNYVIPRPPHPFTAALPIDKSKYYVEPHPGDGLAGARPYFVGGGDLTPITNGKDNDPSTSRNLGPRLTPKSSTDPSGFTLILKSSSAIPSSPGIDGSKPPRRTYRPRGSKNKELGRPGRKPNNANTLAPIGYSNSEFSLQGKGRILSPKPPPTTSQINYPHSGYLPPKFALPSSTPTSSGYLKQYTTNSTPSPLGSQSRPPYDPRDALNTTWNPAGYTYGGPNPPPSQFQSSSDYNIDPSRSSATPQTPYQPPPGYGSYTIPLSSTPIRNTQGAPPPHPFLPANSTPTTFSSQGPYYTPSSGHVPPPAYTRPYPPPNPTWNPSAASSASALPSNGTPVKSYEPKSPPQFIRAPITPQESVKKYYVGDGVYKTAPSAPSAPSTIERQLSLPPSSSQGTVFEEDNYSKDLNRLARNGNWGSGGNPGNGPVGPA